MLRVDVPTAKSTLVVVECPLVSTLSKCWEYDIDPEQWSDSDRQSHLVDITEITLLY